MSQPDRATPREWAGLAVLALPTLLLAMDATVLYLAVPHLAADLRPSANQTLWIVDAYGFMIAGFLVTMGTLGDRIGRRRLLFLGAAAFGVASAVAAYATTPEVLIAARATLGVAGATLMPSTLALISNMFRDPRQRATAIGVWATCMSAGFALGPVLGGLLLEVFWWGSVFLLGVPVMVLLLVTAPLLPEYRDRAAGRLDLTSVGLSLAAILPVVYGVKELAAHGPTVVSVGALVVGAGFATGFVRRQRRLPDPLLDLRMFGNPAFRVALLVLLVGLAAVGGIYLFVTQYLQLVAGMSPLVAGLWLLPATAASIVVSMLTPAVASRIRPGRLVGVALAVSAAGYAVLTLAGGAGGLPVLVAGFVLVYAGNAPIMVLGTDLVVSTAPREKAGSAAAMSETSMEFGVALGVAVLGVVGSAVYRAGVAGSGLGVEAGDSLATATATAAGLPAAPADALLAAARSAFTSGLTTVAGVCAVGVAALAVFAVALLRGAGGDETVAEPVLNGCRQTGDPAGVRPGWHSADDADPAG